MKKCTSCEVLKPLVDFYRRMASPDGHGVICKGCAKAESVRWRELNRDRHRAYSGQWKKGNRDLANASSRRWSGENKESRRRSCREWNRRNPDKRAEFSSRRRTMTVTPGWANKESISAFYKEAKRLEKETGVKHHVDHIVPINSPLVCGLHVESNLQVLPARENVLKRNLYWPDMP